MFMPALVRYTNLHIKPALKGEVGFAQAKAGGVKKEESSLGFVNPSVKPSVCQLPVKGSLLVWCKF